MLPKGEHEQFYYILDDDGKPRPIDDRAQWSKWFGNIENRRVAFTELKQYWISTVFLGLNHAFDGGAPILWETCVFKKKTKGAKYDETVEMKRYTSKNLALSNHERMVKRYGKNG